MFNELAHAMNWLNREQLQKILENHGFAVHDCESKEELRGAIFDNVEDGTIKKNYVIDFGEY